MNREELITAVTEEGYAKILSSGAAVVRTGACTGRSPGAKFIVWDEKTESTIDWSHNQPVSRKEFDSLRADMLKHISDDKQPHFTQTLYAGRDESRQIQLTVHTSTAWQALFANNMFVRKRLNKQPPVCQWELFCLPEFNDHPTVMIDFEQHQVLIKGTWYAGEIKKSIFTALNYTMPEDFTLPMHCSVNTDTTGGNAAVFFGLSGTGKTTLSASSDRVLIGDDEHGWSDEGLFNFEGGCYAKVIRLAQTSEPEIWDAVQQQGAILENVEISDDGKPLFDSERFTENTRGSYPINHIPNASLLGVCGHPENIIFLTCDAFGVLPPVSLLSVDEAVQHFLMGYTAKVAGTEEGVTEPTATFSHCFGAPFMPRPAHDYAQLLHDKVLKHNVNCWLVNTGWSGGSYGTGSRMPISISRSIIDLILSGDLIKGEFNRHLYTNLMIPTKTPIVELNNYIHPEYNWESLDEYESTVHELMRMWATRIKELEEIENEY